MPNEFVETYYKIKLSDELARKNNRNTLHTTLHNDVMHISPTMISNSHNPSNDIHLKITAPPA